MVLRTHSFLPITVAPGAHAIYAGRKWASGLPVPDVVASSANDEDCQSLALFVICHRIPLPNTILLGISRCTTGDWWGCGVFLAVSILSRSLESLGVSFWDSFTLKLSNDLHLVAERCLLFLGMILSLSGREFCGKFKYGRFTTRYDVPVASCRCIAGIGVPDLNRCCRIIISVKILASHTFFAVSEPARYNITRTTPWIILPEGIMIALIMLFPMLCFHISP